LYSALIAPGDETVFVFRGYLPCERSVVAAKWARQTSNGLHRFRCYQLWRRWQLHPVTAWRPFVVSLHHKRIVKRLESFITPFVDAGECIID
jgi:hypothetical protein